MVRSENKAKCKIVDETPTPLKLECPMDIRQFLTTNEAISPILSEKKSCALPCESNGDTLKINAWNFQDPDTNNYISTLESKLADM